MYTKGGKKEKIGRELLSKRSLNNNQQEAMFLQDFTSLSEFKSLNYFSLTKIVDIQFNFTNEFYS